MGERRQISVGLLAHVDAGKTTLAEAMLYLSGSLRKLGRVDHGDCFLDSHRIERDRGITVFSKQARFIWLDNEITILDTPGHADFSAEMERTLRVLDCAVLILAGKDGVQAHTRVLWRLLEKYLVPCILFISKMDLPGADKDKIMAEVQKLDERCVDFSSSFSQRDEQIALCSEGAMDHYLISGSFGDSDLRAMVTKRELFPCFFGSGLHLDGVCELLNGLASLAPEMPVKDRFSARVFKIARDEQGNRLSFLRVTGGELRLRSLLKYIGVDGGLREEKITQIRLYSGSRYDTAERVVCGQICAVLGLSATYPGQGLGEDTDAEGMISEPVMSHRITLAQGYDPAVLYQKLRLLQEEDPQLHIIWNSVRQEIGVSLMGRVQEEVFQSLVKERFDVDIVLDKGRILYRETISGMVEGVGHYEPLRHYAEVHLLLEPLPAGSGIVLNSCCSEDALDRSWQRLILTHLQEKQHLGVLTGSPVTDIRITLASGRAHLKHTEGGDFREATYRAVRQGLMQAESVLLEPWYAFVLDVPSEQIGRAISDVRGMNGEFDSPEDTGDGLLRLTGKAPVSMMNGYLNELLSYSRGQGRLSLRPCGYRPVKEQNSLVKELGYDPESDLENSPDSVFCAHGAGFIVKWNKVSEYMHLPSVLHPRIEQPVSVVRHTLDIDERELEAIMEREFGPIRRAQYRPAVRNEAPGATVQIVQQKETVLVDAYNLIFAWDELKELAKDHMDLARLRLQDMLSNYCGFTKSDLILVFDAYRNAGGPGSREDYHNIRVVYTKDGETGDAYIERIVDEIGKNYRVRVVTSDNLIRLSALRAGVLRTNSKEFVAEVKAVLSQMEDCLKETNRDPHATRLINGTI